MRGLETDEVLTHLVGCEAEEEGSVLGRLSQNSRSKQGRNRCAGLGAKGKLF